MRNSAGILLIVLLLLTLACSRRRTEEEVLWEYYKGFTYSPGLFDSLAQEVRSKQAKSFLMGLKCFEKYSQDKKADCYDSARIIFAELQSKYSESYLGHLGTGILFTERGKFTGEKNLFDSARKHYSRARLAYSRANVENPKNPAFIFFPGRIDYTTDQEKFSLKPIQFLDSTMVFKPVFSKPIKR